MNKIRSQQNEYGSLTTDEPLRVLSVNRSEEGLMCLVEWKARDGIIPKPTLLSTREVKEKFPVILVDYYEARVKFPRSYEVMKKSMSLNN